MFKSIVIAASSAMIAIATPASAEGARSAELVATAVSVSVPATTSAARSVVRPVRYCVVDTPTGTLIPHRTCRSREQWMDQGFDPLAK